MVAFAASLPPIIGDTYGYVTNPNGPEFECWIKNSSYQLCLYIPVSIYLLFSICLMIYCIYAGYKKQLSTLHVRIICFTIVFVIVWIGPVIDRVYSVLQVHQTTPDIPQFIVWWHDIGLGSSGWTNALVWGTSNLWNELNLEMDGNEYHNVENQAGTVANQSPRNSNSAAANSINSRQAK